MFSNVRLTLRSPFLVCSTTWQCPGLNWDMHCTLLFIQFCLFQTCFLDIISIFNMLVFIYAIINTNFFVSWPFFLLKIIKLFSRSKLQHFIHLCRLQPIPKPHSKNHALSVYICVTDFRSLVVYFHSIVKITASEFVQAAVWCRKFTGARAWSCGCALSPSWDLQTAAKFLYNLFFNGSCRHLSATIPRQHFSHTPSTDSQ